MKREMITIRKLEPGDLLIQFEDQIVWIHQIEDIQFNDDELIIKLRMLKLDREDKECQE